MGRTNECFRLSGQNYQNNGQKYDFMYFGVRSNSLELELVYSYAKIEFYLSVRHMRHSNCTHTIISEAQLNFANSIYCKIDHDFMVKV